MGQHCRSTPMNGGVRGPGEFTLYCHNIDICLVTCKRNEVGGEAGSGHSPAVYLLQSSRPPAPPARPPTHPPSLQTLMHCLPTCIRHARRLPPPLMGWYIVAGAHHPSWPFHAHLPLPSQPWLAFLHPSSHGAEHACMPFLTHPLLPTSMHAFPSPCMHFLIPYRTHHACISLPLLTMGFSMP